MVSGAVSSPPISAASAAKILIVDDDPVVRSLMQDSLEDAGFSVMEAEDGVEACRVCEEEVPSLLIVDAVMPNMDGFELCRKLRRGAATQYVPILMATGFDDHHSIMKAYESGATDFIAKPINWLILNHRLRYMLRGARAFEDLRQNQQRLRLAQELQREQRERFEAALSNMSQGLCMFGADGRLIVSNQRFRDIYRLATDSAAPGQPMAEALKGSPLFLDRPHGDAAAGLDEHLALASRLESAVLTQELIDGRVITINHEPMPGGGFVDTFTDVTQQRLAEARIAHMALHDPLTDLPNRVLFRQRLQEAL
jgi:CheY-like chemotaxis protein